jgi:hypothetical protein
MKRVVAFLLGLALLAATTPAVASEYEDSQSHPLRVLAYLVHPFGYALEWAIFRPFHWVVSQPNTEKIFGHVPHGGEVGTDDETL